MKKLYTSGLCILVFLKMLTAQDVKEQVYLHLNSQTLISGQTLYYSAYNNSQATGQQSNLSKVLYVELVGKEGPVHQEKIALSNGRGHGDLFISSVIPSGQYYILAYTKWMKNFDSYFQAPLLIVNPYESYPQPELGMKPKIDFHVTGDQLVAGIDNVVAYHVPTNNPQQFEGRLVSGEGEVMHRFQPDRFGLGKIAFTPKADVTYQVILEDTAGNISFHALPEIVRKGSVINSVETEEYLNVELLTNEISAKQLEYEVLSHGLVVAEGDVSIGRAEKIPTRSLPNGMLTIRIKSDNGKNLERKIWLGQDKVSPQQMESYQKRQLVTVPVDLNAGQYSISVKRKLNSNLNGHNHAAWFKGMNDILAAPVPVAQYLQSDDFDQEILSLVAESRSHQITPNSIRYLPEIREEIMTGKIVDSLGNPVKGKPIALAFPGDPYQLRISESDGRGRFLIPYESPFADHESLITTLDFDPGVDIVTDNPFLTEYPDFEFETPYLDSAQVADLIALSVRNQIENAYFIPEEAEQITNDWSIHLPYDDEYFLDDYERFPTLKETFVEYVVSANVRERRKYPIKTTYFSEIGQETFPPLVLLDGVPVKGDDLLAYDQNQVESIKIVVDQYYLGPYVIDGIIDVASKSKKLSGYKLQDNYLRHPVMGLSQPLHYSFPDYASENPERLPDQRDQLFWDPDFVHSGGTAEFDFYSSDVAGTYEVIIEGFSAAGEPVTNVFQFKIN